MTSFFRARLTWLIGLGLVVTAAAITAIVILRGSSQAAETKKIVPLEFTSADLTYLTPHALNQSLAINGNLDARSQAVVKAKQAVDVLSIAVREGDPVHTGQRLALLDSADLQARLAEKVSARESAKAQFELAEKNRGTNRQLLEKHYISQNAFDSADGTYKANQAALDAAEAEVQLARIALAQTNVVAPVSGIIAKRYLKVGEKASVDSPLFTIVDLDSLELDAMIPASEVAQLARGQAAELVVDGFPGRTFAATLDRISPATEPGTRSVLVFFTVHNPDHVLKSGMFAEGRLALGQSPPVPALPAAAIQTDGGQPVVWSIESKVLTRHVIHTGRRDTAAGWVEVTEGVSGDVPILAAKFDTLKEGAPASITATAGGPPAGTPAHS